MTYFSTIKICEHVLGVRAHACPLCTQETEIRGQTARHPELHTGKDENEANSNVGNMLNEVLVKGRCRVLSPADPESSNPCKSSRVRFLRKSVWCARSGLWWPGKMISDIL